MGSHSVTCHPHKWTHPALTPARQAGTRFAYPGGMEDWVGLGDLLHMIPRWFTCTQTVTHPSTNPAVHSRALAIQLADKLRNGATYGDEILHADPWRRPLSCLCNTLAGSDVDKDHPWHHWEENVLFEKPDTRKCSSIPHKFVQDLHEIA